MGFVRGKINAFHPKTKGRKAYGFRGTTQLRGKTRALVFPITGDDPSAHFLAAAPGRTPQRLTDRLAAGDRSSLGKAMIAELPVQSILSTPIYTIFRRNLQGKIANTQNCSGPGTEKKRLGAGPAVFWLCRYGRRGSAHVLHAGVLGGGDVLDQVGGPLRVRLVHHGFADLDHPIGIVGAHEVHDVVADVACRRWRSLAHGCPVSPGPCGSRRSTSR